MNYTSILIQGNIISSELLDKIRNEEIKYQTPADFELDKNIRLRDEIGVAWAAARGHWTAFKVRRDRLLDTDSGTSETRSSWMLPLLRELGYELETSRAETLPNGKSYAISHRDARRVNMPVHITGVNESLDRKREGVSRLSPHALVQEYLNQTEHVYGLVSNGRQLRLLRDATRLVRLSYLEFNLEKIMEEELYNEFAVLYRLLHASRMPAKPDEAEGSFIEFYHQESLASGNRIREKLSRAVEESILTLANGFLQHTNNEALRRAVQEGRLKPDDYYQQTLRLIYRLLFLMVTEERNLVYPETLDEAQQRLRRIYTDYYSLDRLRKLAGKMLFVDSRKHDLWESLKATFLLFEEGRYGKKLGISPLGSGLFSPRALGDYLPHSQLTNENLLYALHKLSYFTSDSGSLVRVNYSDLDVEEFGSVYEGLLDLKPVVTTIGDTLHFSYEAGTDRKTTGSYYTRPELVRELVRSALDPVIVERLKPYRLPQEREAAEASLLAIKVCDPSAGSGHMLISAARELGLALAQVRTSEDQPSPTAYRDAIRTVIQQCIYGVDYNPAAVELCQVALWMESYNPGKPLSFLDHKIKNGNSLVGVFDLAELTQGIPDDAFNPVTGDDSAAAKLLKKQNKDFRQKGQTTLDFQKAEAKLQAQQQDFAALFQTISRAQQDSLSDIEQVKSRYEKARTGSWWTDWQACNLYTAAFFQTYTDETAPDNPTSERLARYLQNPASTDGRLMGRANALQSQHRFFHWPLEFPEVFANGGFDVIIGNPPWEIVELSEKEFFKTKVPDIANAESNQIRKELIKKLESSNPSLYKSFVYSKHEKDAERKFFQSSNRFPLASSGRIDLYPLFVEHTLKITAPDGRASIIVPSAIAMQAYNATIFSHIVNNRKLSGLLDFENSKGLFVDVDSRQRFCLLSLNGVDVPPQEIDFFFFGKRVDELQIVERRVKITYEDLKIFSPNTLAPPILQGVNDYNLAKRIYTRFGVLIDKRAQRNPWQISIQRMLSLSDANVSFRKFDQLPEKDRIGKDWKRLYSGKNIHQFDHRYASYNGKRSIEVDELSHEDHNQIIATEYYTPAQSVEVRTVNKHPKNWHVVFRDTARATDERTAICAIVPPVGCDSHARNVYIYQSTSIILCFVANFNTLPFDYLIRQKVIGTNLGSTIVNQLPLVLPNYYSDDDLKYIIPRVVELTYTAWDLEFFFKDVWSEADEALRGAILRQWQSNQLAADREPSISIQKPFVWDEERRVLMRAELDAYYARLYGLSEQDLRYVLDPQDVYGPTFPGETFRVLKEKDIRRYGEYRTRRLVLEAFAKLTDSIGEHIPQEYIPPVREPAPVLEPKTARRAAKDTTAKAPKSKLHPQPQPDLFSVTTPLFAAAAQMVVREKAKVTLKTLEGTEWRVIPIKGAMPNTKNGLFQLIDIARGVGSAIMGRKEGDTIEFGGKEWKIMRVE